MTIIRTLVAVGALALAANAARGQSTTWDSTRPTVAPAARICTQDCDSLAVSGSTGTGHGIGGRSGSGGGPAIR